MDFRSVDRRFNRPKGMFRGNEFLVGDAAINRSLRIGVADHGSARSHPAEVYFKDRICTSKFDVNKSFSAACHPPFRDIALGILSASTDLPAFTNRITQEIVFIPFLLVAPLSIYRNSFTLFSCTLFVVCMICHGELARRRPEPAHLTGYYLSIVFLFDRGQESRVIARKKTVIDVLLRTWVPCRDSGFPSCLLL
jgi:hypothetical protein